MKTEKKLLIKTVIIIIFIFGICFIVLDFSRFFSLNYTYDIFPSAILKRINVLLAATIAWAVGSDGLSLRDSRIMKAALLFACLGELLFLAGNIIIGIIMFAVCQVLLIIRNSIGIRVKLTFASYKQKLKLFLSGLITILSIIAFLGLFNFIRKVNCSTIIVYSYGILLSISLWAALSCNILDLLPKRNSQLAAAGMICFYCCDILVGLDAALEGGLYWLLANSFIWVFYTPALVLLALSCYRYDYRPVRY